MPCDASLIIPPFPSALEYPCLGHNTSYLDCSLQMRCWSAVCFRHSA